MGLLDIFKKKEDDGLDPIKDLKLSKLQKGYMVDYDLKTWEVTAYNRYDFGEGYEAHEWELTSENEKVFLEYSHDDEEEYDIAKPISIREIDGDVKNSIINNKKPPDKIVYQGTEYFRDESGTGHMYKDGKGSPEKFRYWDFIDKEDEKYITIEQWDEDEFEASSGYYVEEYQFTNILPR